MSRATAFDRLVDTLRDAGKNIVTITDDKATAQCPAHDDNRASLSIGRRKDGKGAVLYCHAGCQTPDVIAALGLSMRDLFDDPNMRAAYSDRNTYTYPGGRKVHRKPDKAFPQSGNMEDRSLFGSDRVTGDVNPVYVPEGEKDVLAAQSVGAVAVCSAMGAGKAHKADWSPLAGHHVIIVADKDEPNSAGKRSGRDHALDEAELLDGIAPSVRITEAAVGKDLADHIAAGKTLDELVPVGWWTPKTSENKEGETRKAEKRSAASQLVDMARDRYELGIGDDGTPFGVSADVPHVALALRGGKLGLRAELARRYFEKHDNVAAAQALADACAVLEGFAAQQRPQRLHLRVAAHHGTVYIDTADAADRVIAINNAHWAFTDEVPVVFRRTEVTAPMPSPARGGDIAKLWDFINVAKADRPILLAFMVAALIQPDVSHVILGFLAEHGSAKTTNTNRVVSLTDPSEAPTQMPPRDIDKWVHAANGSWVVALDNLSTIPDWLSDALCRAATGEALLKRRLYTDAELAVIKFRRCAILTGIDLGGLNGDLTDRLALVDLQRITEDDRKAEAQLEADWDEHRPAVLGALLDLAAEVHAMLPTITVDRLPRMADFAKVLYCVDKIRHTDGLARYRDRAAHLAADSVASDPFIARLQEVDYACQDRTAAEILAAVTPDEKGWRPAKDWPKKARAVTTQLIKHAPALRSLGWYIDNDNAENKAHATRWTIAPPTPPDRRWKPSSPSSPTSPTDSDQDLFGELETPSSSPTSSPASYAARQASYGDSLTSPKNMPLTCEGELASQASYKYRPSLGERNSTELHHQAGPLDDEPEQAQQTCAMPACGNALLTPEAINSGKCKPCRDKQNAAAPGGLTPTSPGQTERVAAIVKRHNRGGGTA